MVGSGSFEFCGWGNCCSDLQWCLFSVCLTVGLQKTIPLFPSLSRTLWTPERQMLLLSCDWILVANILKTACQAIISLISSPVWKEFTITLEKITTFFPKIEKKIAFEGKKKSTETQESSLKTPLLTCVKWDTNGSYHLLKSASSKEGKYIVSPVWVCEHTSICQP